MKQIVHFFKKTESIFCSWTVKMRKELSLKWDDKTYSFAKDGEKWILELPFSTAVNYVQLVWTAGGFAS